MGRRTDMRKAKRFSEEDQAFLQTQADAIGCDVDTYLCMVVRQMRLGQLPTLAFGQKAPRMVVPAGFDSRPGKLTYVEHGPQFAPAVHEVAPEEWGAPAPLPEQNAPAEEFNFTTAEPIQQTQAAPIPSLVDEIARIATGNAQDSFSGAQASQTPSVSARSLRRSLKASTAPAISGPPGSATRILGPGRSTGADQQGDGRGNVLRQNMRHMGFR